MHVGDIDVMIDVCIYIYCLLQWNVNFFLQFSGSLPSAMGKALGKDFSKKIYIYIISLPSASPQHSAKYFF